MNNKLAIFTIAFAIGIVLFGLYQNYEKYEVQRNKYNEYKLGKANNIFQPMPIKNITNYSFKIVTDEVPVMVIQNPYTNTYDDILNKNATVEMFNVGKDFRWQAITINFNQTTLKLGNAQKTTCDKYFCSTINFSGAILLNVSKLIWDRDNNTMVIE